MSEPSEIPSSDESHESPPNRNRPTRAIRPGLLLACVAIGVVVGGGAALAAWGFRQWRADPTPLPRPWINAPFITTPMDVVDKMLETAEVQESDLVYDLGCGDGRIVVRAAEKYRCRGVGFDIDPERIRESRENAQRHGVEELVAFEEKDVFTLDLSQADVVTIYLLPRYFDKLIPQLQQMRPGSRIVSHDFFIEGVPPDRHIEIVSAEDNQKHNVYLWIAPIKAPPKAKPSE